MRKDVEAIDGRVGETFSGIRVVRAFGRELLELLDYMRGRHTVLRKELFAQRRELVLWTSWGLLVVGRERRDRLVRRRPELRGRASIGDIMAFQWYTFLLMNPVWKIVNSFSELQRSLAAMERVFEVLGDGERTSRTAPTRATRRTSSHEIRVRERGVRVSRGPAGRARLQRRGAGRLGRRARRAQRRGQDDGHGPRRALPRPDARADSAERHRTFATSSSSTYRDLLAIVQQDVFLFDGSVRDNIAYGRHDATDAEVEDAARRANAHEFIEQAARAATRRSSASAA